MSKSEFKKEKSETNYLLVGLLVSSLVIYFRSQIFDVLGFFGFLISLSAVFIFFVFGFAIVALGFNSHRIYEKFIALIFLAIFGDLYFVEIFLSMCNEFLSFHFVSLGFLFLIIPFFMILFSMISILRGHKEKHQEFLLENYLKLPYFLAITLWLIFGHSTFLRVKDGLTEPNEIAKRIYLDSSWSYRIGAYCNDGSKSFATGSGACSHHGGVEDWIEETKYKKTKEQCLKEAYEISWLD
jgi:hypothetical protein